ncbi:hypothetical protein F2P81_020345 [Scophthalmus maximus]|uniref:Uncharacterized protein n=1 Tax=Scophthalmus maximus TaxID=52904 RepID=A0A6A4SA59_SCOMX|nr:hypothetical protein F2P81_020345 [Scophthalmus maximus]
MVYQTNLPDYYRVWLDLANNLTQLIESRKLRDLVHKMPVLTPHLLSNHRELRLAHLALGFISMGYVWQEGQYARALILPKALAWPYWLVSRELGLPPILSYADSVLANWKLRDPRGSCSSNCISWKIENFLLRTNLPDYYWVWLDLANNLTQLRESRKLRNLVHKEYGNWAYNACVSALVDVRSYQLSIVTKYIIVPGNKAHGMGCPLSGVGTGLNTAGTGGSSLMVFLNSTHNATKKALILEKSTV